MSLCKVDQLSRVVWPGTLKTSDINFEIFYFYFCSFLSLFLCLIFLKRTVQHGATSLYLLKEGTGPGHGIVFNFFMILLKQDTEIYLILLDPTQH